MVVAAFPIIKLSILVVKQISKPIANVCKERAKNHPFFRTYVCLPPAQFYSWCEVKAKMWILNLGKPVNIPVLSQEMAIELGANLLGEAVIFFIAAGLLVIEYKRQIKKEAVQEAKLEEMKHITSTINELYFTVQHQQTQLREMERIIYSKSGTKPTTPPPVIKKPNLKSSGDESSKPSPPPPPTAGLTPSPQNMNQMRLQEDNQPIARLLYPNKGIILQPLDYIQMDELSSVFPNHSSQKYVKEVVDEKSSNNQRLQPALTETLHNIENNFRSIY